MPDPSQGCEGVSYFLRWLQLPSSKAVRVTRLLAQRGRRGKERVGGRATGHMPLSMLWDQTSAYFSGLDPIGLMALHRITATPCHWEAKRVAEVSSPLIPRQSLTFNLGLGGQRRGEREPCLSGAQQKVPYQTHRHLQLRSRQQQACFQGHRERLHAEPQALQHPPVPSTSLRLLLPLTTSNREIAKGKKNGSRPAGSEIISPATART
jgi:hypothetical protein